jgi:hypothetical protein
MFQMGQRVIYIKPDGADDDDAAADLLLVDGEIYTIREIDLRCLEEHGVATIRLYERIGGFSPSGWEIGYQPCCFWPLIERKTDISIFTAMLYSSHIKDPV